MAVSEEPTPVGQAGSLAPGEIEAAAVTAEVDKKKVTFEQPPRPVKPEWKTGQRVIIEGLEKAKELNGHRGVVIKFKADVGRYAVRVAGKEMAIKPENLKSEGGAAEAAKFQNKYRNTKGVMYNPTVYSRVPGAGPKMTQWIGKLKAGTRIVVRADVSNSFEDDPDPVPLWYGDRGFVKTAYVDVACLIPDVGPDPKEEWPKALARVLEHFPEASGRLRSYRKGPIDGFQIVLNNAGVPFTFAEVPPCSLPPVEDLQVMAADDQCGFFDPGSPGDMGGDEPLLRFKLITEGGTARGLLGLSFNHALCDISGVASILRWLHCELDRSEPKPRAQPCHDRSHADELIGSTPAECKRLHEPNIEHESEYAKLWPLHSAVLERWCFLARKMRSGIRGRYDGVGTLCLGVPADTLAALKAEAEEDGAAGASSLEALVSYLGMKLLRLGRLGRCVSITKDYRNALKEQDPDSHLDNLFANVVTHGLSFQLPDVSEVDSMPLGESCKSMDAAIKGCSLGYVRWHRGQNHYRGLPNFFGGLCCNSWGRALADISMIEAYAVGMNAIDERASNMSFPLDTAYMQVLPQPSGSYSVLLTMPLGELTTLLKDLPSSHFELPHPSEIRTHSFKCGLPPVMLERLQPEVEKLHHTVRIACIGDSITACGYPKYLQELFDRAEIRVQVRNFGVVGSTAQKFSDKSYWDEQRLETARMWRPHFVLSTFGTNDAKESNWSQEDFEKDYTALCVEFLERTSPRPYVYLIAPPPVYVKDSMEIQQDVINTEVPAAVTRVATAAAHVINDPIEAWAKKHKKELPADVLAATEVVDAFNHLGGIELRRRSYFAEDGVHPNERGTKLLAYVVFGNIRKMVAHRLQKWVDEPRVADGNAAGMF
eukprot:gnl/TRDRNA2_/TRDRNA2_43508_c0_seq1.p1 gnl/TRDRNA2_/TRDRNA2_43508_c0~~gnl/TRDRNA2_/TRDRNA2_43508_c0_seq1.p1  ORF type:complete len:899 (+),score=160.72 gnl/TRDRNA2_/TRDRNA2_43508_c0_seq1:56-2698(+)